MASSLTPTGVAIPTPVTRASVTGSPSDESLLALARARRELAWPEGRDIALANNAHATNTRQQLVEALQGDYDWMEGDVAIQDGKAVMRHRYGDRVDVDLALWVRLVAASGRGAKFDFKDVAALPQVLALVREAGIPAHRLIFNVSRLPPEQLRAIRRAFPDAIINLSPVTDADLSPADLAELQVSARIVGGRVMFPIRIDLLSDTVVRSLRPFGRVAIWNTPLLWNPRHDERARLRAFGVDGMIDLREPRDAVEWLQATAVAGLTRLFGWNAVHRALDAVGLL